MLRLILFAFIVLFILTGTNFGKSLMAEHNIFEEGRSITEKWIGNENIEGQSLPDPLKQSDEFNHDQLIENSPIQVKDEPSLSKDKAITKFLTEFSMTELLTMVEKIRSGLSDEDFAEMKEALKDRFSSEDLEALKQLGKDEFKKYLNRTEE
ncbi:hypothetical protein BTR23_11800 [Alkalihalophilus pseudofirmus]|nr:hypothetical protein BTR23_11800 [Alkalihalophilus pseudofirmus]